MTERDGDVKLVRTGAVRVVDHRDTVTLLAADGTARRFSGDSAALVRAVLDAAATPIARDALESTVAAQAGVDPGSSDARVIREAIDGLVGVSALAEARSAAGTGGPPAKRGTVVLCITGAVAAIDAPVLVRALLARGLEVEIAATPKALRFVGAAGLEALTHRPVHRRVWERDDRQRVPHVTLAEAADLVLVCPASATTISRIAGGDCSDLVSAIAVTTRAPVVVVPSMNSAMYEAPAVRRNLAHLRDDGMYVVHPAFGHEVAHAPDARRAMLGPAPSARAVIDVVELVLATDLRAARAPALPTSPEGWDALYGSMPVEQLPWHADALDADVADVLDRARAGATGDSAAPRLLDLGAGAGTAASAATERGFEVVAIDVSATALAAARRRAGDRAITWVLDDARASTLRGSFDVILDRACLHCLAPGERGGWAQTVTRLAAPGGLLVVKTHAEDLAGRHGTHPPTREDLDALLAAAFDLVDRRDSTLPGPVAETPRAVLSVYRRRDATAP